MIDHVVEYNKENTGIHSPIAISVELEDPTKTRRLLSLLPHADLVVVSQDFATSYGRDSATSAVKAIKLHTKPGAQIVCAWGSCGAASGTAGVIGDVIITPAFAPDCVVDTRRWRYFYRRTNSRPNTSSKPSLCC
ncbi:unnamed protein product [Clavelina lepadiformis]|uniref:Uncharacterized protein n=1 Tax=Clavelina lepadiformis TaxID=159417 RepID=A0ABP0FS99_CLALP